MKYLAQNLEEDLDLKPFGNVQFYRRGRGWLWIRCAWAILVFFILISCAVTSGYVDKIPIFLTYWSFTMLSLYHWAVFINALRFRSKPDFLEAEDRYVKLQLGLFSIANGAAIIVSGLFWMTEYKGTGLTVCNLSLHLLNTAMVLLDIATTTTPVEFRAWKLVSVYGIIYGVFTVIYWLLGGTNHKGEPYVYAMLDYSKHPIRGAMFLFGTCFIAVPLTQALLVWFQRLTRCKRRTTERKLEGPIIVILQDHIAGCAIMTPGDAGAIIGDTGLFLNQKRFTTT